MHLEKIPCDETEATSRPSLVFGSNENLQGQITCISLTLSKQTWSSVNKEKPLRWSWENEGECNNQPLEI